ncbi:MAG: AAA family ATPase [Terrimicrobiaceae bacterium]|nr:AAA family ATPase [Terrimicrobiaceae bacterium]
MKIFDHQSAAYQELLIRAQTYFAGHWRHLPIKTRWHSLIIGPTGGGKSALGTILAAETGAALLRINVTGWMPSGAHNRAVAETISTIIEHIHSHPKSILFLDEIDKVGYETPWNSYIRGELFEILDGVFPVGAKGTEDSSLAVDDQGTLSLSQRNTLAEKLCTTTFVIGAGTFQDFYEAQGGSGQIGFQPEHQTLLQSFGPTPEIIAKKLPREVVNRFNSSLLLIPQLDPSHYKLIAHQAEQSLPSWIQPAFREAASVRLTQAIAARSGCRFVEEALSDALKCAKAPASEPPSPEPDLCDW